MTRRLLVAFITVAVVAACSGEPVGRPCFIPGGPQDKDQPCSATDPAMGCKAGLLCQEVGSPPSFKCQNSLENILASPALECQSRTCLHVGGQDPGTDECTAGCSSDGDCDKVSESKCVGGFICAVAVEVGPFCCKKFCQCKDFVTIPDGGLPDPAGCDSNNPINECCNLSGRRDDNADSRDKYPQCHAQ